MQSISRFIRDKGVAIPILLVQERRHHLNKAPPCNVREQFPYNTACKLLYVSHFLHPCRIPYVVRESIFLLETLSLLYLVY
jgi:hypothetical protein